jgi:hypothetical protein
MGIAQEDGEEAVTQGMDVGRIGEAGPKEVLEIGGGGGGLVKVIGNALADDGAVSIAGLPGALEQRGLEAAEDDPEEAGETCEEADEAGDEDPVEGEHGDREFSIFAG